MRGEPASEDGDPTGGPGGARLLWLPVVIAPLGLGAVILLSMMVSGWRVEQALVVQVEPRWRAAGEALALRVLHIDAERRPIVGGEVRAAVVQGEARAELGAFADAAGSGSAQGRFTAPALASGAASLVLDVTAPGLPPLREVVPIDIVEARPPRSGEVTISQSNLNWGDNTEPQPEGMRIVLRPDRRLLAGFDNTLRVRVTDVEGAPLERRVEIALITGELLGARGSSSSPPVIATGVSDRLGLFAVHGPLSSDVVEVEVRVMAPSVDPAAGEAAGAPVVAGKRRFRMVSFAGGVYLDAAPHAVRPGEPIEIAARGLRSNRPIFVDVHAPDGTWIDTLPPYVGREPPRPWSTAAVPYGLLQVEGYYFTNDPGESTALARVQVDPRAGDEAAGLAPLIAAQREVLEVPRVEKAFDRAVETGYLDRVADLARTPEEVASARAWLLGTLPVRIYGPPIVASTLPRVEAALRARKLAWYRGLRIFLLGGGSLFLLLTLLLLVRRHGQTARATARALGDAAGGDEAAAARAAQRAALVRAWALVVTMGLGLVLTAVALEQILWRV